MIKHENNKYVLYTKDGSKILGRHDSYESALKQERAIQMSKHAAIRTLYHGSPKLLNALGGDGLELFVTPHKGLASLFSVDKSSLRKALGSPRDTSWGYPLWGATEAELSQLPKEILMHHSVKGFEPIRGRSSGYLYELDLDDALLKPFKNKSLSREGIYVGPEISPKSVTQLDIPYVAQYSEEEMEKLVKMLSERTYKAQKHAKFELPEVLYHGPPSKLDTLKPKNLHGDPALSRKLEDLTVKTASAGQGYVALKVSLQDAKKLHKLLSDNGITDLIPPEKMHMTVMYDKSNPSVGYEPSKETYSSRLLSIKELGDGDWKAIVLELIAPEVNARHEDLKAQGYVHSHPSFIPHVSIKYKPVEGDIMKIKSIFDKIAERLPSIRLENEYSEALSNAEEDRSSTKTSSMEKSAISVGFPFQTAKKMLEGGAKSVMGPNTYLAKSGIRDLMERLYRINSRMAQQSPSNASALMDMAGMALPRGNLPVLPTSMASTLKGSMSGVGNKAMTGIDLGTSASALAPKAVPNLPPATASLWGSGAKGFDPRLSRNPELYDKAFANIKSDNLSEYFKYRGGDQWRKANAATMKQSSLNILSEDVSKKVHEKLAAFLVRE